MQGLLTWEDTHRTWSTSGEQGHSNLEKSEDLKLAPRLQEMLHI